MRTPRPTKGDKREARQEMRFTRPPRLEGVVKNAKLKPKKIAEASTFERSRRSKAAKLFGERTKRVSPYQ